MKIISLSFFDISKKAKIRHYFINKSSHRIVISAMFSLIINLFYALYHGILGIRTLSLWFLVMFVYYTILAVTRFSAVLCSYQNRTVYFLDTEYFVMKISGILLMMLSLILIAIIYISMSQNIVTKDNEITMITIATYTFTKITTAIVKAVKQKESHSPFLTVILNISYAEVAVSVLNLQRSMIATFGEMSSADIINRLTGAFVCFFVLLLGVSMLRKCKYRKENQYGKIKNYKSK